MNKLSLVPFVACLFVTITDIELARCNVILSPDNAVAQIGGTTTFACRIDSTGTAHWLLNDLHSKDTVTYIVYDGQAVTASFAARFSVKTGSGFFNLTVSQTQKIDAGHYTCREVSSGKSVSALYIILLSSPVCSTSPASPPSEILVGTQFMLSCKVSYNGSAWQRPFQRWFNYDQQEADSSEVRMVYDSQGHLVEVTVVSDIVITAVPPSISYACQTDFREPCESSDQPAGLSEAVPPYVHRCVTLTALILYPPEDIVISGMTADNTIHVGGILSCVAQGYPTINYTWTDWTQGSVTEGQYYELGHPTGTRKLRCAASNVINGAMYTDQCNFTITVTEARGAAVNWFEKQSEEVCELSVSAGTPPPDTTTAATTLRTTTTIGVCLGVAAVIVQMATGWL